MEDSDFFVKLSSFSEHISNFLYKFFQIGFVKIHSFQKSNFAACQLACHSHWERSKLESALGNSTKRRDRHAAAGQHPAHLMVLSLAHGHKAAAGAERAEISRAADRSVAQREPGAEGGAVRLPGLALVDGIINFPDRMARRDEPVRQLSVVRQKRRPDVSLSSRPTGARPRYCGGSSSITVRSRGSSVEVT